jgi:hypothetical protein
LAGSEGKRNAVERGSIFEVNAQFIRHETDPLLGGRRAPVEAVNVL